MYYSSESSDSENGKDSDRLDFSYLMLDSETVGYHLQNSVLEQIGNEKMVKKVCNVCQQFLSDSKTHQCKKALEGNYSVADSKVLDIPQSQSVRKKDNATQKLVLDLSRLIGDSESPYVHVPQEKMTERLYLQHNLMTFIPSEIILFSKITYLDISNNNMSSLSELLLDLVNLESMMVRNNALNDNCFPKDLSAWTMLRELNLSGNQLTIIPPQLFGVTSLKYLYFGGNQIVEVSPDIKKLQNLQVLHLGGNQLEEVPSELGELPSLGILALCDNKLKRLPRVISRLTKLRSLLLHNNNLCCLPVEIVKLRGLSELSIRDNPLVRKFVNCCAREIMYTPPSLMELAARAIKLKKIAYEENEIPRTVQLYLNSGHKCVNPKCKVK